MAAVVADEWEINRSNMHVRSLFFVNLSLLLHLSLPLMLIRLFAHLIRILDYPNGLASAYANWHQHHRPMFDKDVYCIENENILRYAPVRLSALNQPTSQPASQSFSQLDCLVVSQTIDNIPTSVQHQHLHNHRHQHHHHHLQQTIMAFCWRFCCVALHRIRQQATM